MTRSIQDIRQSEWLRKKWEVAMVLLVLSVGAIAITSLYGAGSETARRAVCSSNLRDIGRATEMYSADYDGLSAPVDRWQRAIAQYLDSFDVFNCPSDFTVRHHKKSKTHIVGTSYWYQAVPIDSGSALSGDRVYTSLIGNHIGGGNVVYTDGHINWIKMSSWERLNLPLQPVFEK